MSDHIDQDLKDALHWDDDADWEVGMPDVEVRTKSGAVYRVDSAGIVIGGSKNLKGSVLYGAVYRAGGPIRSNQIVVGMCMEIAHGTEGKALITSPVIAVIYQKEE